MRLIDISPRLSEKTAVFPGDVAFQCSRAMDFGLGHHLTLSSMTASLHIGSHADAPVHYSKDGEGIDQRSLALYIGHCWVARVQNTRGRGIGLKDLSEKTREALSGVPVGSTQRVRRVLIATGSFPDPDSWNDDFSSVEPELVRWFHERGVVLLGIDTPSIDPADSKSLEAHTAVSTANMAVLEGLCLDGVQEGVYFLSALPLKVEGGDAGPVRAILIEGDLRDVSPEELVVEAARRPFNRF